MAYLFFLSKIIFRNPFNTKDAGVSPGCTLDDIKITYKMVCQQLQSFFSGQTLKAHTNLFIFKRMAAIGRTRK